MNRVIMGNWKMHTTLSEAEDLARDISSRVGRPSKTQVVVCPPFPSLNRVREVLSESPVQVGAQDIHWAEEGAFTGEVSASMVETLGCEYTLVGHSERRVHKEDTVETTALKLRAALGSKLRPVLCVGEGADHREKDLTGEVVGTQISPIFFLDSAAAARVMVAYEPVWAIGSGRAATPQDADEVCGFIRDWIERVHGKSVARSIPILYGGSVKPDNVSGFLLQKNVDGVLVGGASLDPEAFASLVRASEGATD